ncbi:MAG: family 1 glycosylhydrolase [Kiritimatiellales bacterium]
MMKRTVMAGCLCAALIVSADRTEVFDFESRVRGLDNAALSLTSSDGERIDGTSLKVELNSTNGTPACLYTFPTDLLKAGGRYEISVQFRILSRGSGSRVYLQVNCDQNWKTWPDLLILRGNRTSQDVGYHGTQRCEVILKEQSTGNHLSLYGAGRATVVIDNVTIRQRERLGKRELYGKEYLVPVANDTAPYTPYGLCTHADWSPELSFPPDYGTYADDDLKKAVSMWKELGIQWIRISPDWARLFPQSADSVSEKYQARCEMIMDLCDAVGIQYYLQLGATPRWASSHSDESDFWAYAETDPDDWDRYVRYLVRRYGNRVDYYEIGNETDWHFWHSSDEAYVSRLIRSAEIIRKLDPSAKILNAGLSSDGVYGSSHPDIRNNYLQRLFDLGAGPYIDIFSEHMYTANVEECLYRINRFYRVMKENGAGDKPIWITEIGYSTHKNRTDDQQSAYIRDICTVLLSHPKVDKVFLYNFRCKGTDGDELEDRFGIVEHDFTPRPAYTVLKDLPKRRQRLINSYFLSIDFPNAAGKNETGLRRGTE